MKHIPTGRVTQVLVGRTTGARVLDAAAVKALLQWRYKPGGRAVPRNHATPAVAASNERRNAHNVTYDVHAKKGGGMTSFNFMKHIVDVAK